MSKCRLSIVNRSQGKYRVENTDGREYVVVDMLAIEGDTVMNGIFYPQPAVAASAPSLDMLPAPDGHPEMNGAPISAFHPIAVNMHNFGGFVRNPRLKGKQLLAELAVDTEVAERTERGKSIVERLKSDTPVGVSTGVIADLMDETGEAEGQQYWQRADSIKYDHVAVLMDENPAGQNTYTLNHDKPSKRRVRMDTEIILDLSPLAKEDRERVSRLTVNQILELAKGKPNFEDAKRVVNDAGFEVNQIKPDLIAEYTQNAEAFKAFREKQETDRKERIEFIVKNSKLTSEQLKGLPDATLQSIHDSVTPAATGVIMNAGTSGGLQLIDDDAPRAKRGK